VLQIVIEMGEDHMSIHEECGVFGVYDPEGDCARTAYYGLYALQHRGQEACGIAAVNDRELSFHKDVGLVKNRCIGRTFITPGQENREQAVRIKLGPLRSCVEGKRVVMVDEFFQNPLDSHAASWVRVCSGGGRDEIIREPSGKARRRQCADTALLR